MANQLRQLPHLWAADTNFLEGLGQGALLTVVYGLIGIGLVVVGFKVFDWITPKIDIQRELAEKNNLAVAIVVAAIILGICYLVTATVD